MKFNKNFLLSLVVFIFPVLFSSVNVSNMYKYYKNISAKLLYPFDFKNSTCCIEEINSVSAIH